MKFEPEADFYLHESIEKIRFRLVFGLYVFVLLPVIYYKDNVLIFRTIINIDMRKCLLMFAAVLLVVSCRDELKPIVDAGKAMSAQSENKYAISVDEALENLDEFLMDSDNPLTRTPTRVVCSVTPVKYRSSATKGEIDSLDCGNLLYVANFERNQGYAILAADKRIESKVIAVVDEGNMSDATVYTAMDIASAERVLVDGYPMDGPGFFTTPETGGEIFMNPNTVILYDEIENDTLVGNFSLENTGATDDDNTNDDEQLPILYVDAVQVLSSPELITGALCAAYATNQILGADKFGNGSHDHEFMDHMTGEQPPTHVTETGSWSTKVSVEPILAKYASWRQGDPFNKLYPMRKKYWLWGEEDYAPAGCFPLAIAKILAHFEYPSLFIFNDNIVNWYELKKSFDSPIGITSAAALLRGISVGCDSWCFYNGTFTFPSRATSYMRDLMLENSRSYDYNFDKVTGMLDNGCPLIIYSVPAINVFKSHSWNIDGYKIKERTITTQYFVGNTLKNTSTSTETCKMVHCDFGWKGTCNGYYVDGVFKLDDSGIERDPGTSNGGCSTHYNNLIKIITYDRP